MSRRNVIRKQMRVQIQIDLATYLLDSEGILSRLFPRLGITHVMPQELAQAREDILEILEDLQNELATS